MVRLFKARAAAEEAPPPLVLPFYRQRRMNRWAKLAVYAGLAVLCFAYGLSYARFAPYLMVPFAIPIAVLAILVVWALPSGDYAPTKALQPLYVTFFAALFIWPNYLAIALPGLPWITLLRLTGLPLLFTLLVCLSVSGQFRAHLKEVFNYDPWISRLLPLFVALMTVSIVYSVRPSASVSRYVVATTNWISIFFVTLVLFTRPGFPLRWMKLLMALATIVALLGVWESFTSRVLWAGHIPSILKIEDEAVLRALAGTARAATGKYRVQSTYGTPLGLSEFMGLVAPFAVHLLLTGHRAAVRAFAAVYLVTALYVVIATDSRLGLISSLLSGLLYLLFWSLLRWRRDRGSIMAPAIVLAYPAIFCFGVAATFAIGRLRAKVWGGGAQAASNDARAAQWETAWPKIFSHPHGHGVGQAGGVLGYVGADGIPTIDSYFLNMLLDYGFIGFVLYFGMFGRGVWIGARAIIGGNLNRELQLLLPLTIALINYIIIKSVFSQEDNHPLAFIMLAAVVALSRRADLAQPLAEATDEPRVSRSTRFLRPQLRLGASGLRRGTDPG